MGDLVPVLAMEVLPGDRIRIGSENLARLAPMVAPMMHRVDVRVEYFFVPNRLIWDNWEKWITNGGDDPVEPSDVLPAHPTIAYGDGTGGTLQYNKLCDYLGLPDPAQCPISTGSETVSALPFAAYQKIYNDYYRDQNLIDKVTDLCVDGNNNGQPQLFTLRKRAWEADYFTKALPFAQKGESVDVPLGEIQLKSGWDTNSTPVFEIAGPAFPTVDTNIMQDGTGTSFIHAASVPGIANKMAYDPNGSLEAGNTTINDLRLAYRLQEWLEKNARGGTRYAELIRSHFNVSPQDSRLQRSEYIVGTKNAIQISEVLNTTGTTDAPQGSMAGHGVQYAAGNWGKYFAQEHGYVIGIMSIMPKTAYQQGIPRHFLKYNDPTEVAWPTFANLGEQPVQNREIMAFYDSGTGSTETFGYMPRYMEYKNLHSRVAGEFRTSLDFWHMGRIFSKFTPPVLNQESASTNS